MPTFLAHLRAEIEISESGLLHLEACRSDLISAGKACAGDLRLTLYGLRLIFLQSYLVKVTTLLLPALKASHVFQSVTSNHETMMRKFAKLLMEVDSANMELNAEALTWHMSELLHSVRSLIDYEKNVVFPLAKETLDDAEQERLYSLAIEMDKAHAFERIQGKQILLNPVLARA
ncbi:MAG TPA: hypothetical protein VM432_09630 [Bdellovibrionales bacterium]|nr:hypothetical protein [Bdellovibrionales bacterium]